MKFLSYYYKLLLNELIFTFSALTKALTQSAKTVAARQETTNKMATAFIVV